MTPILEGGARGHVVEDKGGASPDERCAGSRDMSNKVTCYVRGRFETFSTLRPTWIAEVLPMSRIEFGVTTCEVCQPSQLRSHCLFSLTNICFFL